jgi:hypothetical protein
LLLLASGEDVPNVMAEVGHADPKVTLAIYARAIRRRDKLEDAYAEAFDAALTWIARPSANGRITGRKSAPCGETAGQATLENRLQSNRGR